MKAVTIKDVIHQTAKQFNMPVEVVVSKNVRREVVLVRHIAMYVANKLTYKSLRVIATACGMSYAGTVAHAVRSVAALIEKDPKVETDVKAILKSLNTEENDHVSEKLPDTNRA